MFTGDPNHVPTYTDGTVIKQQDLADMNMNGLQRIAEMIGIELGDWKQWKKLNIIHSIL